MGHIYHHILILFLKLSALRHGTHAHDYDCGPFEVLSFV